MKSHIRLLSAALLVAVAPVANAQTAGEVDTQVSTLDATAANHGQTLVATRIASSFTSLAGSRDNSLALVWALRDGTPVTLQPTTDTTATTGTGTGTGTATPASTTITPPTGKMGWGNVFISLALAKTALANVGITDPTAEELQAALTGGTVTAADGSTVTLKGVLEMRAEGMGWGQIAQAEGTKLGPVVSSIKSARVRVASLPSTGASKSLAVGSAKAKGITTAAGSGTTTATSRGHQGIVTATGTASSFVGGHGSKGITTASGAAAASGSRGIVTAEGSLGGGSAGHGHGYGRGLVTAAGGGSFGAASFGSSGHGAGVVTAAGSAAASSAGITTAQGGGGNGASGKMHGRGKGGG